MTNGLQQQETNIKNNTPMTYGLQQYETNINNKYNNDIRFVAIGD